MTRLAALVTACAALPWAALLAGAAAQAAQPPARAAFGWLERLAGSCWEGREWNGGTLSTVCYRFDDEGRRLQVMRPGGTRHAVESSIGVEGEALVWRSELAGSDWHCVLRSGRYEIARSPAAAVNCSYSDPPSGRWPPGRHEIEIAPLGPDRFRVTQTHRYGGGTDATSRRGWTFVRQPGPAR